MNGDEMLAYLMVGLLGANIVRAIWQSSAEQDEEGIRRLRSRRRFDIGAFPDEGEGRIVGVVSPEAPLLIAPVSGRACVAYMVRVSRYGGRKRGRAQRDGVREISNAVDFAVNDATGRAVVRAAMAQLALTLERADQSDSLCPPSARIGAFLEEHGLTSEGEAFRYDEGALVPGERVAVFGAGHHEALDDESARSATGYREQAKRLVMSATRGNVLLISNAQAAFE